MLHAQPIKSSFNDENLAVLAFTENDEVILYFSNDRGETWSNEVIGQNLVTEVDNREGVFPLFTNFAQASYVLDNEGTVHIGMNGYGILVEDDDTSFTYPALYWNSRNREWIAISDPAHEGEQLTELYPGNGIGNAYPTPAITANGNEVSMFYQGPEFDQEELLLYDGDGTTNKYKCYYTDIKFTYSNDGGATFGHPYTIAGKSSEAEIFPCSYDLFSYRGGFGYQYVGWVLMYMMDEIPGSSILDENSASEETYWNFVEFGELTNIGEQENIIKKFNLSQNYPNPFNPATSIEYQVASIEKVSLKVYDILGREIKTLVNEIKSPGTYELTFDASELSSGIYFYRLTSGSFTKTRKMILMK
ncbi:MAG: T9SS type A sorting domain-containing protein [Melioribacteraceae bacterium]|nr:T9SS type A sorting domain-containing protein [Melioribacteraceae bacterium]